MIQSSEPLHIIHSKIGISAFAIRMFFPLILFCYLRIIPRRATLGGKFPQESISHRKKHYFNNPPEDSG